jgi:hypothetical protein
MPRVRYLINARHHQLTHVVSYDGQQVTYWYIDSNFIYLTTLDKSVGHHAYSAILLSA